MTNKEKATAESATTKPNADILRSCIDKAFRAGAKNFIYSIWHDASKMPNEGKRILYIVQYGNEIVDVKTTITALYDFTPWDKVVSNYGITKWCYIDDLLPEGGGE